MVRAGRDRRAPRTPGQPSLPSPPLLSSPCAPGHCGREGVGRRCGPGRAAARFGGAGPDGAGAQRRRRRSGSGRLPSLPTDSCGPCSGRCASPRVPPVERAGLKWPICAFHAALPAPPLRSEEGKAGARGGGRWEWHAEAQRPPCHRGLLRSSDKLRCAEASCCRGGGEELFVGLQRSSMSACTGSDCSWLRP